MQQDTPLTDLCSICHVNQIKYTCPRDGVHTCSLPCVKRHKQRAQCSGIRNPAEYRKRSELATPASVDKDFNFITAVERSIFRADEVVAVKGIDLVPARLQFNDTRSSWERGLENRGIKLIRAPKGLSRNQQNKTQWHKRSSCIAWTVEWICQDGRKGVSNALEIRPVKDSYEAAFTTRKNPRKRRQNSAPNDRPQDPDEGDHTDGDNPEKSTSKRTMSEEQSTEKVESAKNGLNTPRTKSGLATSNPSSSETASKQTSPQNSNSNSILSFSTPTESTSPDIHFYLHRPGTESRIKCLIPLPPDITLREAINDRTLIEFPTIYVRTEPPDKLKKPFMTEEEYVSRHGADIPINVVVPMVVEEGGERGEDLEEGEIEEISEKKVLEVLAKDLGS